MVGTKPAPLTSSGTTFVFFSMRWIACVVYRCSCQGGHPLHRECDACCNGPETTVCCFLQGQAAWTGSAAANVALGSGSRASRAPELPTPHQVVGGTPGLLEPARNPLRASAAWLSVQQGGTCMSHLGLNALRGLPVVTYRSITGPGAPVLGGAHRPGCAAESAARSSRRPNNNTIPR